MQRLKFPILTLAFVAAFQLLGAANAYAHAVHLIAAGVCEADTLRVTFTVSGGSSLLEGSHPDVRVSFNSVQVGAYALTVANGNSVTDTLDAPGAPGGTVVVTALANGPWADGAEGGDSASVSVTLPTDCVSTTPGVGRFTGGGKSIDFASGLKVTKGFTIHCDLILSNNLEINWPVVGGKGTNQFHMLEHTSATCTDDPAISQRPPAAPVDTIIGVGTGRYNGVDGYTVNFTLVDAGEPGTSDQIGFVITGPGGGVVLNLPLQNITGGNVQAHYDQPHKN